MQGIIDDPAVGRALASAVLRSGLRATDVPPSPRPEWLARRDAQIVLVTATRTPGRIRNLSTGDRPNLEPLGDHLAAEDSGELILILPASTTATATRDQLLTTIFGERVVVVGLPVPISRATDSLRWCRRALDFYRAGRLPSTLSDAVAARQQPIRCPDIILELILGADQALVDHTADLITAPLRDLSPFRRSMLLETLGGWAPRWQAGVPAVAKVLGRHPQTIRYRLKLLTDLFGSDLTDERQMLLASISLGRRDQNQQLPDG